MIKWWKSLNKNKKTFSSRRLNPILGQKCSIMRPLLSITCPQGLQISKKFGHWTSGSGGKKTVKRSEQMKKKKSVKKTVSAVAILHHFWAKKFRSETSSFHYFFNQWEALNWSCDLRANERPQEKSHGKGTSNTQTDTHTHMDMSTTRPTRPRGLS